MKVVALISGGKDSCYVMLRCAAHGHEVVALAHITPPSGTPEPDSHMYQSVGSAAVPALAAALHLPLHVRETCANARVRKLHYAPQQGDEVEDLVLLLRDVIEAHPQVQAVCAGALWSDYQRLRVESAAARVGLMSLAYLWRRDQRELLDEMIGSGLVAVLVKVAGIGLGPQHLGKSLSEMRKHLLELHDRYGSHVCGEGGEYETLVLSLPTFAHDLAWQNEDDAAVVIHSDDTVAPVAYLDIKRLHPVEKVDGSSAQAMNGRIPPAPPVPEALRPIPGDLFPFPVAAAPISATNQWQQHIDAGNSREGQKLPSGTVVVSFKRIDSYIHVIAKSGRAGAEGVTAAVQAIRETIQKESGNAESGPDPLRDVVFVWLRLASLSSADYASANTAYSAQFGTETCTPPPARACVGMRGTGAAVTMEVLLRLGRRDDPDTVTLHVQSISEWAPPCIGPYAQTVYDANILHICGVLPLYAPTVSIPKDLGARAQTRAALFNMCRTLEATPGSFKDVRIFVVYLVAESIADAVEDEVRTAYAAFCGQHFRGIIALIPVDSLPKNALVEIRAVAAVDRMSRGTPVVHSEFGIQVQKLGYRLIEIHSVDNPEGVSSYISAKLEDTAVLSAHIFIRQDKLRVFAKEGGSIPGSAELQAGLESLLRGEGLDTAVLVTTVDWLAHGAKVLCIATTVSEG
jgi:diphthine-ammonia ligase